MLKSNITRDVIYSGPLVKRVKGVDVEEMLGAVEEILQDIIDRRYSHGRLDERIEDLGALNDGLLKQMDLRNTR